MDVWELSVSETFPLCIPHPVWKQDYSFKLLLAWDFVALLFKNCMQHTNNATSLFIYAESTMTGTKATY